MDYQSIIDKYYPSENELRRILLVHSRQVADRSLKISKAHPELRLDEEFLEEAAMLHDIGIFRCDAPSIQCFGTEPYIRHGVIGAELMRQEGWERHALVCERHTGTGLSKRDIEQQQLPLPHQDYMPVALEEQVICYADLKSRLPNLHRNGSRLTLNRHRDRSFPGCSACCAAVPRISRKTADRAQRTYVFLQYRPPASRRISGTA